MIAKDEDFDYVTFKSIYQPKNMTIDNNGKLLFNPDSLNIGPDSIIIQLSDGLQHSNWFKWNYRIIDPLNKDPKFVFFPISKRLRLLRLEMNLLPNFTSILLQGQPPYLFSIHINPNSKFHQDKSPSATYKWTPLLSSTLGILSYYLHCRR